MKSNILRRSLICGILGITAGLLVLLSGEHFRLRDVLVVTVLFAVASFIPLNVLPYVASNFFGKKK
jgi:hypothetical protein